MVFDIAATRLVAEGSAVACAAQVSDGNIRGFGREGGFFDSRVSYGFRYGFRVCIYISRRSIRL